MKRANDSGEMVGKAFVIVPKVENTSCVDAGFHGPLIQPFYLLLQTLELARETAHLITMFTLPLFVSSLYLSAECRDVRREEEAQQA